MTELATADDTSQMFGEKSYTKLRAISRNAQNLTDKINGPRAQSPEKQNQEFCRKKLQTVEAAIRCVRAVDASQHDNALRELRSVTTFMTAEPKLKLIVLICSGKQ